MLDALIRLNAFLYHSVEVLLADGHILWLQGRIAFRSRRIRLRTEQIRRLEADLERSKGQPSRPD